MAKIYLALIQKGIKTWEELEALKDVPSRIREEVKRLLEGVDADD